MDWSRKEKIKILPNAWRRPIVDRYLYKNSEIFNEVHDDQYISFIKRNYFIVDLVEIVIEKHCWFFNSYVYA